MFGGSHNDDVYAGNLWRMVRRPLKPGQIRNFMALCYKRFSDFTKPSLRPPDRVRVKAVVN
jgi:hypothetical protein